MNPFWFILLAILSLAALAALLWWRFKGSEVPKPANPVATSNHESLRVRHYGAKPVPLVPAPAVAAPPPAAGSALDMLMPEEDFHRAEAARLAAEQAAERERAEPSPPIEEVTTTAHGPVSPESAPQPAPAPTPPAAGPVAGGQVPRRVDVPVAPAESEDEPVAESLYDNPLTAIANTTNDARNSLTATELRQRKRMTLTANSGRQRAALAGLFTQPGPV